MSQSFFLRSIDSDLSVGGALFNRKLLDATAGASSQEVAAAQSQILDGYAFTEPGVPGTDGGPGDYTVSIHITAGATQINVSSRVARVNSSGTVQAESAFSTPDPGNAGIKVHDLTSVDLGTWAEGDRLRVQYRFENTDSMMARTLTIEKNTVETEAITPWEGDEPEPASGSGEIVGEGVLTGDGSAPAAPPSGGSGEIVGEGVVEGTGSAPIGDVDEITPEVLTADSSTTDTTSYTTASVDLTADRLVTIAIVGSSSGSPPDPTPSGLGLSWTKAAGPIPASTTRKLWFFEAHTDTGPSGQITIPFGATTMTGCAWSVVQWTAETNPADINDTNIATQGSDVTGTQNSVSATFPSALAPDSASYGAVWKADQDDVTPGGSYTELSDVSYAAPVTSLTDAWFLGDEGPSFSWPTSRAYGLIGIEITEGVSGVPPASGSGEIAAEGVIDGDGHADHSGSGEVVAEGSLEGTGYAVAEGSGEVVAEGSLVGTGLAPTVGGASGSGAIEAVGSFAGTGLAPTVPGSGGSGSVVARGSLEGQGFASATGSGEIVGSGELEGTGYVTAEGSGEIVVEGELVGAAFSTAPASDISILVGLSLVRERASIDTTRVRERVLVGTIRQSMDMDDSRVKELVAPEGSRVRELVSVGSTRESWDVGESRQGVEVGESRIERV